MTKSKPTAEEISEAIESSDYEYLADQIDPTEPEASSKLSNPITIYQLEFDDLARRVDNLATKVASIEARLNCTCSPRLSITMAAHEQWCQSYVKPTARTRDCYKCGNLGMIPNHSMSSMATEYDICPVCSGKGSVEEQWRDGVLVWPDTN